MLTLHNLNIYYGESHILRNVSFTVEAGEIVCLMGRNGVGKTTTLKGIMGLLPVRSGAVKLDGYEGRRTYLCRGRSLESCLDIFNGDDILHEGHTCEFQKLAHACES